MEIKTVGIINQPDKKATSKYIFYVLYPTLRRPKKKKKDCARILMTNPFYFVGQNLCIPILSWKGKERNKQMPPIV